MRIARMALPLVLLTLALAMAGCCGGQPGMRADIPPADLPDNPDPCVQYCREWVPPVYRKVPKMVKVCDGTTRTVETTEMLTEYHEVKVKPCECDIKYGCGDSCEETVVEAQAGGWRWVNKSGCWKYEYCPPRYKWCNRVVKEEGIEYCVERPAKYETVATSRPVKKSRCEYVPATYKTVYVNELYRPGHYVWKAKTDCSGCEGNSCWKQGPRIKRVVARDCACSN